VKNCKSSPLTELIRNAVEVVILKIFTFQDEMKNWEKKGISGEFM